MSTAKIAVIKDERVLAQVVAIIGKDAKAKGVRWEPGHQMKLIWNLFRTNPAMKYAEMTKEEKVAAFKQWEADWSNGRLAYPSNTARSLAEGGYAASGSTSIDLDEEVI